jgi:hypothetical protein
MALELTDNASFSGTISNTSSENLTVESRSSEYFEVVVDNDNGAVPSSYDLTVEFYSTALDKFMQVDSVSGSTDRVPSVTNDARGQQVKITLTNSSGADSDYGISLESFKEI